VLDGFADAQTPLFYFTHAAQTDVLLRKKEVYDGATPSGNAVMVQNLFQLSIVLDKPEWRARAGQALAAMGNMALTYPTSFGVWLQAILQEVQGTAEIAIVGENQQAYLKDVLHLYLPHRVVMASQGSTDAYPLLRGKQADAETRIYLCQNYACRQPVTSIAAFETLIQSNIQAINNK
jgi:uncharacterized protein YyaL (SSP411 family)